MVKLKTRGGTFPPQAFHRGRVLVLEGKYGTHAQSWPRKRGPSRTPGDRWWRTTWGWAAQMAARPHALDLEFAARWTENTQFVPRDLLQLAALGQLFSIVLPDGTEFWSVLKVAGNPQATLDLITNEPGAMLFRSTVGWVRVPPGNPGQVLEYQGPDNIRWADGSGGGAGGRVYTTIRAYSMVNHNFLGGKPIVFSEAIEDILGAWLGPSDPTIFVVPPTKARLTVNCWMTARPNFQSGRAWQFLETRATPADPWSLSHPGIVGYVSPISNAFRTQITLNDRPVVPGHQYRWILQTDTDPEVTMEGCDIQFAWG